MVSNSEGDAGRSSKKIRSVVRLPAAGLTVGTRLMTPGGEKPVEDLKRGDRVLTKDFGYQDVKCVAFCDVDLRRSDAQSPIKISENCLGHSKPTADVYVAPNQRIAVRHPLFEPVFGHCEVVAQACDMLDLAGFNKVRGLSGITYVLLGFTQPQLVLTGSMVLDLGGLGATSTRPALSSDEARLACGMLAPRLTYTEQMRPPLH